MKTNIDRKEIPLLLLPLPIKFNCQQNYRKAIFHETWAKGVTRAMEEPITHIMFRFFDTANDINVHART